MANWKLVIVSGSTAELAGLQLDTALAVAYGGTGQSTLSSGQVLLGAGTSGITSVARGDIADSGGGKIIVSGGTSAALGTGVTLNIGGNVASGSKLNDISGLAATDSNIIVGNGTTWVAESGATARTSLGLGTGNTVQFTNINNTGTTANSHLTGSFTGSFTGDGSQLTGLPSAAINSYTNAANNRLVTSVDATTVNSEANLTFDGSVLGITGRLNASGAITGSKIQLTGIAAGVDNTVVVVSSTGELVSDEIDSRVWGSTLVDGAGAATRLAYWSDADTLTSNAGFTFDGTVATIGSSTFGTNVVIAGDLTVQGTTTNLNITNVNVEDRFILLNSGSSTGDGGIIVQNNAATKGYAFGFDDSADRWGFQGNVLLHATGSVLVPEAFAAMAIDVDAGQSDIALYQKNGNIKVDGGNIYIYA